MLKRHCVIFETCWRFFLRCEISQIMQRHENNQISYTLYRNAGVNRNQVWFEESPCKTRTDRKTFLKTILENKSHMKRRTCDVGREFESEKLVQTKNVVSTT